MKAAVVKSPLARHPQIVSTFARSKKRKLSATQLPGYGNGGVFTSQKCGTKLQI